MERYTSRRQMLAAVGLGSTALAGCMDFLSDDDGNGSGDGDGNGGDDTSGTDGSDGGDGDGESVEWPAIETGEVLSDFEDLEQWETLSGSLDAAPDEAQTGSQAAVLESDGERAAIQITFPDGLDMNGWDTSIAVKPESATRIVVEFIAPTQNERLNSVKIIPEEFDDWLRLDCGYEHKPEGEPDLSDLFQLNIIAVGPEDGPTRVFLDDLRRTEGVDNGKAILAFYDGHSSHYDIAAELLEERGWAGAIPVEPGRIGSGPRMDTGQLRKLQQEGWDVCAYPGGDGGLAQMGDSQRRSILESARDSLEQRGFADGSRHFFAPNWREMDPDTLAVVRDVFDSGFMFGSCPVGVPPTNPHMIPVTWGPALHGGVRRHINLCDQYNQLVVLRIPPIVEEDAEESQMSLDDFEHLLDHLEHRGLDVITPSDLVDGELGGGEADEEEELERPDGTIFEEGESYSFTGEDDATSEEFDLSEGLVVGEFSQEDDEEFVVELVAADDDGRDTSLIETTESSGESAAVVPEGTYQFSVDGDGEWEIDVEQPEVHSDDLTDLPVEASGTGASFVGPYWTEDSVSLSISHDGDEEFVVDGIGADGHREQIVNQSGEFDGSRSYGAGGVVWLVVEADGDWSLEMDHS
ncbi:polysaccharide deacetylase family protein [Natrononativus amylolyticus]|uniref:polysaccharide deacetylase family protein n=1 Tax=Natrononativus amylolyticus TaxID=2963434 RepID=UPI0020CC0029|nr:polysaccharide deacetylase [Natrononativus amylolyticus]